MNDLWLPLIPIVLTDALNPVLFAALVYTAGTKHPVAKSSTLLLGHTFTYFVVGIFMAVGLERLADRLANPRSVDFGVELLLGVVLLFLAVLASRGSPEESTEREGELGFAKAFGLGAIINLIGAPFAVPYFAALGQILKAELSVEGSLLVLLGYNLAYAALFAIVPILRGVMGDNSTVHLQRINRGLDRASSVLMPVLLTLLGLALSADAIHYFVKGAPLW